MSFETRVAEVVPSVDRPISDALVSARARTLTVWGARATVLIGVAHTVYFAVRTHGSWGGWLTGELWGSGARDAAHMETARDFWQLPASFVVPMVLLALVASRLARSGRALPGYVGWTFAAWIVVCGGILLPSGFLLGVVPAGMFIAAHHVNSKALRAD
ncbi:hypothetical protein [Yinghuangia seranimata]|uniref:hypothetical protein n=1 Tax=Yinghuangia seranimata TaxID=408067 RepID=UPI00248C396D|nr:hypothetical protein [Yinghuangia seranimata]MDI2131073.1 hypothetical protein [Yinghuangia seranimata]